MLKGKSDRINVVDVHSSVDDLVQTEMSDASFCTSSCEYRIHHFNGKTDIHQESHNPGSLGNHEFFTTK